MTRWVLHFTTLLLMLFLVVGKFGFAQEIFATLVGTVTDPSGAVIPNAMVTVHNNESGIDVRAVTTDGSGNFTVTNLAAGNYTIIVKSPGFSTYTAKNVTLNV